MFEFEDDVKKHERCEGCQYKRIVHTNSGFNFYGCYHKPYIGKRVAEIKDCPKKKAGVQNDSLDASN